ncbi:MAG TPA: hypothetical protein VJ764_06285 [Steroidobacteraceae bacterium]|nr:hypothetical protein [Steroidobacteraceae bacterium]
MSSNASPALELELRPTWIVLAALLGWMLSVGCELWSVEPGTGAWRILALASFVVGLPELSGLTPGLSARSVRRVTWMADGTWRLCDGFGWEWSAMLVGGSHRWGPIAIVAWSAGERRWWAILAPATVGASQYRRFSVRWRLQRHA